CSDNAHRGPGRSGRAADSTPVRARTDIGKGVDYRPGAGASRRPTRALRGAWRASRRDDLHASTANAGEPGHSGDRSATRERGPKTATAVYDPRVDPARANWFQRRQPV